LLRELRIALRSKQELSLQVVDMDGLKKINDGIGHLAGDQALALLGKVLRQATRTTDFVCRYGGDEFVIILPKSQTEGSKIVGTRIIEALKEMQVPVANGEISISASIGGVTLEVSQTPSRDFPQPIPSSYFEAMLKHMIQEADKALYAVKHQGGNSINIDNIINWIPVD
jgi:diguanylate cyclase (GGDEF)-like protein